MGTQRNGGGRGDRGWRDDRGEPGGTIRLSCRDLHEGGALVAIAGELDVATAERTVRYISDVIDRHHGPVSVDLSDLAFCDACGLGAMLKVAAHAERSGRRIEFTRPRRSLIKIMRITGVNHLLAPAALAG
jgi:anti-anti-sigma factor